MRHAINLLLALLLAGALCTLLWGADDIDAVLDKAEAAVGGPSVLDGLQAVRIRSHGDWEMPARGIPPAPYKTDIVFQRPDHFLLTMEFPEELGGKFTFGYDGEDAWGIFGGPPARCKGWHREMIMQMAMEVQLFLLAPARAAHAANMRLETEGSSGTYKVVYYPIDDDKPWNVWVDSDSGHIVKLQHPSYQMDGKPILAHITRSEPRDFSGINYPSRAKFEAFRDDKLLEVAVETIDSVELNPKLSDDFFACPAWEVDADTIGVKDVPEALTVNFTHHGPYSDIGNSLGPMMDVILDAGLIPVGAASGTHIDDPSNTPPEKLRSALSVRVVKVKEGDPTLPALYDYDLATQPAMRVAYTYHRGDYSGEGEVYGRLWAWIAQQGLRPIAPPRAIWFHDPEVTVTEDLVTEVQIPVEEEARDKNKGVRFNPLPLNTDWSRWLVGEWIGRGESDAGSGHTTERVEMALNGQFLMITGEGLVTNISAKQREYLRTQLHASDEEIERFLSTPFQSLALYTIDQKSGEIVGHLFDSLRCMATGRGNWRGNKLTMDWQWATGHTSTRITERLSDDQARVVEHIAMPDGSTMEESSQMVRKK